ncbi:PREDICTED: long-chain-fatty-acid--CoA ligase ACSBG2-like [Chrysochloris asiatica]|uniref:long-chain-fatty-acid--CoA ligase n=1 Tax=Chrysochloris asiatica TaxID=185453 RepID=A0A9B0TRH1_CHRAS|nr:PREDICTED: long-chain-fatty-acid--CoA ligase ACSBG2-like [Chrysochloris asiatica]
MSFLKHLDPPDGMSKMHRCFWTTRPDGEVQLRLGRDSLAAGAPLTVHDLILDAATKYSNYIALGSKHKKGWHMLTYIEYYEECRRAAKAFLQLGLERFHGVGIMGLNSEEWVIASLGAIMAGGFSVGILSTNSPKVCQVIAENSQVDIFVVDGDRQLQKVIQIRGFLKQLKAIVQYKEVIRMGQPDLYSWTDFLNLAGGISDEVLDRVIDSQKPNQCCMLVYRLNVSGPPKVIMLSHDNSLPYHCPPRGQEVIVSYLPLSCITSQLFDVWVSIAVGGTLYFAQPDALRGSLLDTLREVRPTTFYGVPQVWDRMLDGLREAQLAASPFRRKLNKWAMRLGLQVNRKQIQPPLCFCLASRLTFRPARRFLGLDQCRQLFNTGLGLPENALHYFLSLDIPIFELYSLDECTGVHSFNSGQAFQLLSCGKGLPGTRTKVHEENEQGVGAIHVWGRHIFMGYLNDQASTKEKVDASGWLYTGDLGFQDHSKFLFLTGSVQDIITLKSGEKVNPVPIEEQLKKLIPIVRYVMVVGQDAPYLCALFTLKCQVSPESGEPWNALTSEAVMFCRRLKSSSTRLTDVLYNRDPIITKFIDQAIDTTNARTTEESAKIIKWKILDNDFSVAGGELGATTKLKRAVVAKIYQTEIQSLYTEGNKKD